MGSECVEIGGVIVKGIRLAIAQEKMLVSTIHLFVDFTTSFWIFCLSMRLSELRPKSLLNNLTTLLSKLLYLY